MKKVLILVFLFMGCEGFAVFKHEHSHEHQISGVCIMRSNASGDYSCYISKTHKWCIALDMDDGNDSADDVYEWVSDITCEEFCAEPSTYECTIIP